MTIYTRNNPPQGFYVYMYLREDNTPYYVGKGQKKRAWESHKRRNNTEVRPPADDRITFYKAGLTEDEAKELEIALIKEYGRKDRGTGILRNLTAGGDGTTGSSFKQPEHSNIKRSNAMRGRKKSPEHIAKMAASKRGKQLTEEHRKKQSEALKGRKQTPEHIANAIANRKGKARSAECRAKISATKKAKALALKS